MLAARCYDLDISLHLYYQYILYFVSSLPFSISREWAAIRETVVEARVPLAEVYRLLVTAQYLKTSTSCTLTKLVNQAPR